jgi:hypothetical protein
MKKFSFSWKVFLVVNYAQMVIYLLMCVAIITVMFKDSNTPDDNLYMTLFIAGLLLIAINSAINTHALHRYFPDRRLPSENKIVLIVFWTLSLLLYAGIAFITYIGYKEAFNTDYPSPKRSNNAVIITLALLSISWLMGVYILIGQIQISGYLSMNSKRKMTSLINSIGEEKL